MLSEAFSSRGSGAVLSALDISMHVYMEGLPCTCTLCLLLSDSGTECSIKSISRDLRDSYGLSDVAYIGNGGSANFF